MTSKRLPTSKVLTLLVALGLLLAACGGDDGGVASDVQAAPDGPGPDTGDATVGGAGHWAALELCALSDEDAVGAVFPDMTITEATGIDDPDWSACLWKDADAEPLSPEETLVSANSNAYEGNGFSESATPLDLAGADDAVLFDDFDGTEAAMIVVKGDESLTVNYPIGTEAGPDLAEQMATTWLDAQIAG